MSEKEYDHLDLYCSVNIPCYMYDPGIILLYDPLNLLKFLNHV